MDNNFSYTLSYMSVGFVITIVCKVSGNFREVDVSLKDTVFEYITYKSSLIQNNL